MENNKKSYSWISTLDRLPDRDGAYVCTVRVEYFRNNILTEVSEYVRLTEFVSNKFVLGLQMDQNDEVYYKTFVTDWLEQPVAVKRDHSIAIHPEYEHV
jgi:type II restriction/modification system DNA methylase subunit YeeA